MRDSLADHTAVLRSEPTPRSAGGQDRPGRDGRERESITIHLLALRPWSLQEWIPVLEYLQLSRGSSTVMF